MTTEPTTVVLSRRVDKEQEIFEPFRQCLESCEARLLPPSGQGQTFLFYPFSANCFTRSSPRQGQFSVSGIRLAGNKFRGARMDPTLKHAARITAFMARNIFLKSNPPFKSDSYIVVKWKTGPLTLEMLSQEQPTQQDGGFNHQSVRHRSGLLSHSWV